MITAFNDSLNYSWLANVAGTYRAFKQVGEKMLDVFFSTSTLILPKPNLGKTGDPVTNVKNVFNVASLDDKMYCSKYLCTFTNSVSSYSIDCITVWASKLLFNKNRSRKVSGMDFIALPNPKISKPELKWSNNGFLLIIMSCKSKCWIMFHRFPS